jgi:excisionase family DNA binding protein
MATQSPIPAPDGASPLLASYIDREQLARELGRTLRTVDRLILCEGLPCVRIGNKRLFRRSAVLEWLRERETPARPQSKRNARGAR